MALHYRALIPFLSALAALCWQVPAAADPPPWAPAYRAREHDEDRDDDRRDGHSHHAVHYRHGGHHGYHGYGGDDWDEDYGVVRSGHCNTDVVLGVTGAVTGAVIGNRTSSPENREIATVFGAIAGGIIGSAVGEAIDDGDRACMGHSLELGRLGHPVEWHNPRNHAYWLLVPVRDVSRDCREFDVRRRYDGRYYRERAVACRRGRGDWVVRR